MVTNKIKFLDNKTNYFLSIFLLAYTIFISHYFYSYIDWSGDYSLYIMQAKALSKNSVNILLEKMEISLGLSPNSNPYTPSHYPWGFPTILVLTSFLHKWNLFFIKLNRLVIANCMIIMKTTCTWNSLYEKMRKISTSFKLLN